MKESKPDYRATVFNAIQNAMIEKNTEQPPVQPAPTPDASDDIAVIFAQRYTKRGGTMYYCANEQEIAFQLQQLCQHLGDMTLYCCNENLSNYLTHLGLTNAVPAQANQRQSIGVLLSDGLMADTGEIVLTSQQGIGTTFLTLPPVCIVMAFTSQVVKDWQQANNRLIEMYKHYPDNVYVLSPRKAQDQREIDVQLILIEDE